VIEPSTTIDTISYQAERLLPEASETIAAVRLKLHSPPLSMQKVSTYQQLSEQNLSPGTISLHMTPKHDRPEDDADVAVMQISFRVG